MRRGASDRSWLNISCIDILCQDIFGQRLWRTHSCVPHDRATYNRDMRDAQTALASELPFLPDRPAVFLLWATTGKPYLAKTALLRRRLKTLLGDRGRLSRIPSFAGVV